MLNINEILFLFLFSNAYFHNERFVNTQILQLQSRIQHELYKALIGETVRLECPQPNATWFFRKFNSEPSSNDNLDDIIVTRHGIINSDYKYKIMCHMTLKHKVILINNIDFNEEGLYTCLYTLPPDSVSKTNSFIHQVKDSIQFRYVFNVTVYTLLSDIKMNYFPDWERNNLLNSNHFENKNYNYRPKELIENSLTVKEGDEITITCIVENSKPAAEIIFFIKNKNIGVTKNDILSLNNNDFISYLTLSPYTHAPKIYSLISQESNYSKNNDHTFKTIHSVRLKANREDDKKSFGCRAENGFSNQKWEIKKTLNVIYAPVCKDPPNFVYYVGINQTINVECRILNANPTKIFYNWNLENIMKMNKIKELNHLEISQFKSIMLRPDYLSPKFHFKSDAIFFQNEDFESRFKWMPTDLSQFGKISCKATNEIGSVECGYEIKLGGIPNPPSDCTYTLKNSSAIISCIVGFHQGDPDIYCYLLKKTESEVYKEHTRNRESCSFIVNDLNLNKLNEFWIYSSNKYGHNKDLGFHLSIGHDPKPIEPESKKNMILIGMIIAVFMFCFISCCFCFRLKKGLIEDNESALDNDLYHKNSLDDIKTKQSSPEKLMKGSKIKNCNFKNGLTDKYLSIELSDPILNPSKKNNVIVKNEGKFIGMNPLNFQKINFNYNTENRKAFLNELNYSDSVSNLKNKKLPQSSIENLTTLEIQKNDFNSTNSVNEKKIEINGEIINFREKNLFFYQNLHDNSEKHTNTTVTSISGSSDSNELSKSNFDFDSSGSSLFFRNKFAFNDQNDNNGSIFLQNNKFNRLSRFSSLKNKHLISSGHYKNFQKDLLSSLPKPYQESNFFDNGDCSAKQSDSFDANCLNNLSKDLEVSLNVDCADGYSVNDLSDDYNFENEIKIMPTYVKNKTNSTEHIDKTVIKSSENNLNINNKKTNFFQNNSEYTSINKNSIDRQTNLNKNHLGILV